MTLIRPNEILSPHHAQIASQDGHWVIGGCDNMAKAYGLDRRVVQTVKDPFGLDAQLFLTNAFANIHPCIRMDYEFAGAGYVGAIESALTWSAHFKYQSAGHVKLVIFNRKRMIPHDATFRFDESGTVSVLETQNAENLTVYQEALRDGWHRLGIGLRGGTEVGDTKNVFLYPSTNPDPVTVGLGSYIAGVKLEKGIGMTTYQPPR